MLEKFKILGKKREYEGHIVDFYSYDMQVPNGNRVTWDIIAVSYTHLRAHET